MFKYFTGLDKKEYLDKIVTEDLSSYSCFAV